MLIEVNSSITYLLYTQYCFVILSIALTVVSKLFDVMLDFLSVNPFLEYLSNNVVKVVSQFTI